MTLYRIRKRWQAENSKRRIFYHKGHNVFTKDEGYMRLRREKFFVPVVYFFVTLVAKKMEVFL